MDLLVLGAGPAYTDRPGALGSSYLLMDDGEAIVLDLGQGTFPSLAQAIQPSRLQGVVISHLHPDHFIDLVALRHYLRYEFEPPRRVRVWGPRELERRLDLLLGEPGFCAASLEIASPDSSGSAASLRAGPFSIEAARVTHTDESYAFRVTVMGASGRGLVYSGDCGRADDLRALIRPGDILLSEVSFGPGPVPTGAQHLDGPAVGAVAAEAGVSRVLLTHLQMGFDPLATVDAVAARFSGPVAFVEPGDRVAL